MNNRTAEAQTCRPSERSGYECCMYECVRHNCRISFSNSINDPSPEILSKKADPKVFRRHDHQVITAAVLYSRILYWRTRPIFILSFWCRFYRFCQSFFWSCRSFVSRFSDLADHLSVVFPDLIDHFIFNLSFFWSCRSAVWSPGMFLFWFFCFSDDQ